MEHSVHIRGIPISFPFEPYQIQQDYMEKVIECLQNETNGVLESPTGTGKTLSLLCSSLAWLTIKKAQMQAQYAIRVSQENYMENIKEELSAVAGATTNRSGTAFLGLPTIIYASRTHSQLTQAMQELKRTSYNHMKASVMGSREQLCIHPEVSQQTTNTAKVHMCRMLCSTRNCNFFNRVERKKDEPEIRNLTVVDIEDLIKVGQQHKFCPYYMAKELKQHADIIFMPYNYLLDPKTRKALGIELANNVIILDEAHNIERICEDAASLQIRTTDITLCIEEVTEVMKAMSLDATQFLDTDLQKDFSAEELVVLKGLLLALEKAIDEIPLKNQAEGTVYEGTYIFEVFGKAGINDVNHQMVIGLIDKIIQFLTTLQQGPFARKGNGLSILQDLLSIVFGNLTDDYKDKINKCYKVHLAIEEEKKRKVADNWLSKATAGSSGCRVLSYWCFSPGYGMNMLMEQGVRTVILTSGTLAPLKPLISELELNVSVRLENPHIVTKDQICVKILPKGPDGETLNSNFQNRNNPQYISSLGRTILNLCRIIPDGLLIFFPSYPILYKCQESWQGDGIWSSIFEHKHIFVEPKQKDAFNTAMTEYYKKINDATMNGAIFMAVCRGKVSEGLDFADTNGRAVIVTGLPYPPLKDPRIILKKRYLDLCHASNKEYLSGDDWYSLEASRAINQAIGRVIRHQHDYGAILLLDTRFNSFKIKNQLSLWLRDHVKVADNFGLLVRDLRSFFKTASATLPTPKLKPVKSSQAEYTTAVPAMFESVNSYRKKKNFDFSSCATSGSLNASSSNCLTSDSDSSVASVKIHRRVKPANGIKQYLSPQTGNAAKRKKINLIDKKSISDAKENASVNEGSIVDYIKMVQGTLDEGKFKMFLQALTAYRDVKNYEILIQDLDAIFNDIPHLRYMLQGLTPFIRQCDKKNYETYWDSVK